MSSFPDDPPIEACIQRLEEIIQLLEQHLDYLALFATDNSLSQRFLVLCQRHRFSFWQQTRTYRLILEDEALDRQAATETYQAVIRYIANLIVYSNVVQRLLQQLVYSDLSAGLQEALQEMATLIAQIRTRVTSQPSSLEPTNLEDYHRLVTLWEQELEHLNQHICSYEFEPEQEEPHPGDPSIPAVYEDISAVDAQITYLKNCIQLAQRINRYLQEW